MTDNLTKDKAVNVMRKHKFEIQVYEADWEKADPINGQPIWKPIMGCPQLDGGRPTVIEVSSKNELKELQQQYALCDQKFKIIREIDPFPFDDDTTQKESINKSNSTIVQPTSNEPIKVEPQSALTKDSNHNENDVHVVQPKKAKIITIGDIEVKYDGDKVYQKQWIKLTPAESTSFRIVNDSNNKIVNMNGKHLEAKKWVLVEEINDNDADVVDSLLKG